MPDPRAFIRDFMLNNRAEINFNPGESGNNERVENIYFHIFDSDTKFNGEDFLAGEMLIGGNSAGESNMKWLPSVQLWQFRVGTDNIVTVGQQLTSRGQSDVPLEIEVTNGDIDIDMLDADGYEHSYVIITASTGAFRIASIKTTQHDGFKIDIHNDSANDMTIGNNVYAGSPPSGYTGTYTLTGADVVMTTFSYASFRFKQTATVSGTQYFCRFHQG